MIWAWRAATAVVTFFALPAPLAFGQACDWSAYCAPSGMDAGCSACDPGYGAIGGYACPGAAGWPDDCGAPYPAVGCAAASAPPPAVWSLAVGALTLGRDHGNNYTFSYDDPDEERQYLNQRDAEFGWAPGFEARLARYDACRGTGAEFIYWQLFPSDEEATVLGSSLTGNLSAILDYSQLNYNANPANIYTDNAFAHRLRREMSVYNFEANHALVLCDPCGSGATISSLIGFRLFRFDESLQFASDPNDAMFTYETDELYYDIETNNLLVGCQLGGGVCRPVTCRLSLTAIAKAGVYGNFAESSSRIGGSAGAAVINNGAYNGVSWVINSNKTDVAMMAEMALGFAYQPTRLWRVTADYRVIGVSGVALPTNQIYPDLRGVNDVALLQTNGHLLLHGAYLGVERNF